MSEKRDLAIVGLLLGLLGGALVLASSLGPYDRNLSNITLDSVVRSAVFIILGVAILFGSLLLYRGRYSTGGILNLLLGIVVLIIGPDRLGGVLALISGVAGLIANGARS
jgi:hypothetical protein